MVEADEVGVMVKVGFGWWYSLWEGEEEGEEEEEEWEFRIMQQL